MPTIGDPALALALAVLIAAIYIAVLRLIDINEKEPLWALGLVLCVGALAGAILPLIVESPRLEFEFVTASVAQEAAKFVALGIGVALLGVIGNLRGFSEVNGVGDGIVYGAAAGLGYAVGDTLVRELGASEARALVPVGTFTLLWSTALVGLAQGLFSAITGAGFGAALNRSGLARVFLPVLGLVGAVIVHYLYLKLGRGDALGGSDALVRAWVALLIPLALVAAALAASLARERRTIADELAAEEESGTVSSEELRLLKSPVARRGAYSRRFFSGDFDGWLAMRSLQNRQVQLALAKRRAARPGGEADVERLRVAVAHARRQLEAASGPGAQAQAGGS